MRVRILLMICLFAALAITQGFAAESPDAAALGQMEGLLDGCTKANPQSAADYKKQREELVRGVSDKDLAKMRKADDYNAAYKEISDRFDKTSKDEVAQSCKVLLGTAESSAKGTQKDTKKETHK
jgi:hypothetical protein